MNEALSKSMVDELHHHKDGGSLWPRMKASADALTRRGLLRALGTSRYAITPDGLAALAEWEATTCPKCGGPMRPGIAMGQTYTAGTPDFGPDDEVRTFSAGGPGEVVQVRKCAKCGHSTT